MFSVLGEFILLHMWCKKIVTIALEHCPTSKSFSHRPPPSSYLLYQTHCGTCVSDVLVMLIQRPEVNYLLELGYNMPWWCKCFSIVKSRFSHSIERQEEIKDTGSAIQWELLWFGYCNHDRLWLSTVLMMFYFCVCVWTLRVTPEAKGKVHWINLTAWVTAKDTSHTQRERERDHINCYLEHNLKVLSQFFYYYFYWARTR